MVNFLKIHNLWHVSGLTAFPRVGYHNHVEAYGLGKDFVDIKVRISDC